MLDNLFLTELINNVDRTRMPLRSFKGVRDIIRKGNGENSAMECCFSTRL